MCSGQCAIGLQTDCMVVVLTPVVRLLDSHVYAMDCQPCKNARVLISVFSFQHRCKQVFSVHWGLDTAVHAAVRSGNGYGPYSRTNPSLGTPLA